MEHFDPTKITRLVGDNEELIPPPDSSTERQHSRLCVYVMVLLLVHIIIELWAGILKSFICMPGKLLR